MEPPGVYDAKAVIYTKKVGEKQHFITLLQRTSRIIFPDEFSSSEKDMVQYLRQTFPEIQDRKLIKWKGDKELPDLLVKYEKSNRVRKYKFGILYAKENQVDEREWYGNSKFHLLKLLIYPVTASKEFDEFLTFIGEKINLLVSTHSESNP